MLLNHTDSIEKLSSKLLDPKTCLENDFGVSKVVIPIRYIKTKNRKKKEFAKFQTLLEENVD